MHLVELNVLPMTLVDRALPFIPETIWIYFTEYLIFIVSWVALDDPMERTKYWYSYMGILMVSTVIFVLWPTTFPRESFPLDGFPGGISKSAFEYFRAQMDTPANCLPSLHVSSCFIASFVFWKVSKPKFWFFLVWAIAVAISTMTTKQHYFIDVWTAILLTVASYYYFYFCVSYSSARDRAQSFKALVE